jgi:hypothetical protein
VRSNSSMLLLFTLLLHFLPVLTNANSAGIGPACLDATKTLCQLECPDNEPRAWAKLNANGKLYPCCPLGMDLVKPPTVSSSYRVTFGDGTSLNYEPCHVYNIDLDVLEKDKKYMGLLIYLTNSENAKVGQFILPSTDDARGEASSPKYFLPEACSGSAVMHQNANDKHYHTSFQWQAPKTGTGKLKLHVLLKHGQTNGGEFFWPGKIYANGVVHSIPTEGVILTEVDAPTTATTSRWYLAKRGVSCDAVCSENGGGTCDLDKMKELTDLTDSAKMYKDVSKYYGCRPPLISVDGDNTCKKASFLTDSDGSCLYRTDSTCTTDKTSLCSTATQENGRLCACKSLTNVDYTKSCPSAETSHIGLGGKDDKATNKDKAPKYGGDKKDPVFDGVPIIKEVAFPSLDLTLKVKLIGTEAWIYMTGPKDKWFGVSFGTKVMSSNSYALIFEKHGGIHERTLANHNAGTKLKESSLLYVDNYNIDGGRHRTQTAMRPLDHSNSKEYFSFNSIIKHGGPLDIMVAVGQGGSYGYHSPTSRETGILDFDVVAASDNDKEVTSDGGQIRYSPIQWLLIVIACIFLTLNSIEPVHGHNWIQNPRSRIDGLSRDGSPCPARPEGDIQIAIKQGDTFPIEWSDGHPNSDYYFTIVSRENEDKLKELTDDIRNEYIRDAPDAATSRGSFLNDVFFDKTHVRFDVESQHAVPGNPANGGNQYSKILQKGDLLYYERPDDWRCNRHSKGKTCKAAEAAGLGVVKQYQYTKDAVANDLRVAYRNTKYPWIVSMYKYKVNYKRPKDSSMARFAFPASATPGEYVLQMQWRGYYDCFDIALLSGVTTPPKPADPVTKPELTTVTTWVKEEHSQFVTWSNTNNRKQKFNRCMVVPTNGDTSGCIQACLDNKDKNGESRCNAINIVLLKNPSIVVFQNDVNIPWHTNCVQSTVEKDAAGREDALVCYGVWQPDSPEVGNPWISSDDLRDAVFYSTILRQNKVTKVPGVGSGSSGNEKTSAPSWMYGDQCISCDKAMEKVTGLNVTTWKAENKCKKCIIP